MSRFFHDGTEEHVFLAILDSFKAYELDFKKIQDGVATAIKKHFGPNENYDNVHLDSAQELMFVLSRDTSKPQDQLELLYYAGLYLVGGQHGLNGPITSHITMSDIGLTENQKDSFMKLLKEKIPANFELRTPPDFAEAYEELKQKAIGLGNYRLPEKGLEK